MYKTIRHGENSLQYTILPQNDDLRIDGKLTSASSSNSNGKVKSKRSARRRSFLAYLGLLFVCAVIIGAILIPFLMSVECLRNPSDWFLKTKAAFTGTANRIGASSLPVMTTTISPNTFIPTNEQIYYQPIDSTIQPYLTKSSSTLVSQKSDSQKVIGEAGDKQSNNSIEMSPTEISESQIANEFVAEVRFEGSREQMQANVVPTIRTAIRYNDQNNPTGLEDGILPALTTSILPTMKPSTTTLLPNMKGRVMQVPLLKSASKKPIIPPVLAKTNSLGREHIKVFLRNEEKKKDHNQPNNWIRSHWPYIDPSTYFQWTGYKTEDSVILPAILGAALIVIIMITALFVIARNKGTIVNSFRKRNRNDIEGAGEDNTTLLINSNLSDED
ncbi:uncharacterized protein LOC129947818 [Eupeodes corollae]|uniref:uncharacterized protein LOC129947818 n=1 Tax=Eupeodes corollae TaxID=290404 RepID=UPI0024917123|nr:uncharacterized protein LOC129947818 [Eupeodes corollae]